MLRFPLKQEVLLVVQGGDIFVGKINFAAKDVLTVVDMKKRIYQPGNNVPFYDVEVASKFIFDRHKVVGYSHLQDEKDFDKIFEENKQTKPKGRVIYMAREGDNNV